ncbi:MAG: hypothetical protein ACLSAP_07070 [Oscillospiraceae bacterium]
MCCSSESRVDSALPPPQTSLLPEEGQRRQSSRWCLNARRCGYSAHHRVRYPQPEHAAFRRRIGCLEPGQTAEVETPLSPPAGDVRDAEYAVAILTEGRYSVLLRCRCTLCKGVLHEYTPAPGSVELNRYLFKTRRFFRGKNRLRP